MFSIAMSSSKGLLANTPQCTQQPWCIWQCLKRCEDLRAPYELGNLVNEVGNFGQLLTPRQTGCNVAQACKVLAEHHGANQAVVAGCVHDALLILNSPSSGGYALCEADKDLQQA